MRRNLHTNGWRKAANTLCFQHFVALSADFNETARIKPPGLKVERERQDDGTW
jgi:hypothetical protein